MKRAVGDLVPPVVAGSLVAFAAVLTLLPIVLAITQTSAESPEANSIEIRDAATATPTPSAVTPQSSIRPRPGDRKETTT